MLCISVNWSRRLGMMHSSSSEIESLSISSISKSSGNWIRARFIVGDENVLKCFSTSTLPIGWASQNVFSVLITTNGQRGDDSASKWISSVSRKFSSDGDVWIDDDDCWARLVWEVWRGDVVLSVLWWDTNCSLRDSRIVPVTAVTPSLTAKRERKTDNSCSAVSNSDWRRGDSFSIRFVRFCSIESFFGKGKRRWEFVVVESLISDWLSVVDDKFVIVDGIEIICS